LVQREEGDIMVLSKNWNKDKIQKTILRAIQVIIIAALIYAIIKAII